MKKAASVCAALIALLLAGAGKARSIEIPLDQVGAPGAKAQASNIAFVDIERVFNEHPLTKRLKDDFAADADRRKREIAAMQASINDMERTIVSSTSLLGVERAELDELKNIGTRGKNAPRLSTSTVNTGQAAPGAQLPAGATSPANAAPLQGGTTAPLSGGATVQLPSGTSAQAPAPAPAPAPAHESAESAALIASLEKDIQQKEAGIPKMKADLEQRRSDLQQKIQQNKQDLVALEAKQTQTVLTDIYHILQRIAVEENLTIILDKNNVLYGQGTQDITDKVRERLRGR